MSFICGVGNLFTICIISIFVHTQADGVPSMADIKNSVSTVCNEVEELPQKFCQTIIDPIEVRFKKECWRTVNKVCEDMPWALKLLIPVGECEEELHSILCDSIADGIDHAVTECIEQIEKLLIAQGCNAEGDKVNMCDGLPTTVDGVCTAATDYLCGKLPFPLDPIIPYCQETLASVMCKDL